MRALIFSVLTIVGISSIAYAETLICDAHNVAQMQSKNSFESLGDLFSQVGNESKLHIFGEIHTYTDRNFLAKIVRDGAKWLPGENKCLFLELPEGGLALLNKRFQDLRAQAKTPVEIKRTDQMAQYYPTLVKSAEGQGMRVFEIDHPGELSGDISENERNGAMANRAVYLLTHGCDSAMLFVGKAHVSPLEPDIKSLPERLNELGLKPLTYNLIDKSDGAPEPNFRSWSNVCNVPQTVPTAFSNSNLKPHTLLFPMMKYSDRDVLWNDFDYSIIDQK
jgi:hypothetical protein